jgi:hypothetical protein
MTPQFCLPRSSKNFTRHDPWFSRIKADFSRLGEAKSGFAESLRTDRSLRVLLVDVKVMWSWTTVENASLATAQGIFLENQGMPKMTNACSVDLVSPTQAAPIHFSAIEIKAVDEAVFRCRVQPASGARDRILPTISTARSPSFPAARH